MKYRPDIDGLRAISVLGVVLFHAGLGAPGGFLGVDVFFVVSGYLITSLIAHDLEAGRFGLVRFWERRIRRIQPAVLAMTAAVLAYGCWRMMPSDYRILANDAIAQVLMVSNVRFWQSQDYFALSSDLKPLLHTWSLAVEEQFYLLYPVLVACLWRHARRALVPVVAMIVVFGFVASMVAAERWPSAAFYLLPFRAWELALGALVVLAPCRPARLRHLHGVAGVVGLSLVVLSFLVFDRATSSTGLGAVVPCVGAAMILWGGEKSDSQVARALGCLPLRLAGSISYSLYLWHWPVLSFAHLRWGPVLPGAVLASSLAISLLLALFSYFLIERPIRFGFRHWQLRQVVVLASVVSGVTLLAAGLIRWSGGFPSRFSAEAVAFAAPVGESTDWDWRANDASSCFRPIGSPLVQGQPPCFMIIGDSHGLSIADEVDRLARDRGIAGSASLSGGFIPLPGVWRPLLGPVDAARAERIKFESELHSRLQSWRPSNIILVARWSAYLASDVPDIESESGLIARCESETTNPDAAQSAMEFGFQRLLEITEPLGTQLWVLLEVPYQFKRPQLLALESALTGIVKLDGTTSKEHAVHQSVVRDVMGRLVSPRVHLIDLAAPFFQHGHASVVGRPGVSWYRDNDHVSAFGAREALGEVLAELIGSIERVCRSAPISRHAGPGVVPPTSAPAP